MSKKVPDVIANWYILENLGSGYSGSIHRAVHVHTGQEVALKIQDVHHECPTNRYERGFYPSLQGGVGMPTLWAAGIEGKYDYLAIDLLGASLDSLYRKSGKDCMDLRSVCCIAMQVISRLEFMHSRGILHRDIQLGNCAVGLPPNQDTVYMIDFGFSKRYIDPHTHRHIEDSKVKRDFIGNYWFSSVGVHCRGKVPSRRDDMEAVALMLIHLLTPGGLSWTRNGVPKSDAAHERLKREKRNARPEDLCRGLPAVFEEFLRYCRRLQFAERPDYENWVEEFRELAVERGFPASSSFVWPPTEVVGTRIAPPLKRPAAIAPNEVEGILNGLAQMQLGERQVLGNRENGVNAARPPKDDAAKTSVANAKKPKGVGAEIIEISSEEEDARGENAHAVRLPKAVQLARLAAAVSNAADNAGLSRAVNEFVEVLRANRSRTLTKEGFAFLDALYKQLADPSVFVVPLRTRSAKHGEGEVVAPLAKMSKLRVLCRDVGKAGSNRTLAGMVADFGAVIDKSNGRTLTKDGFGFLQGLAQRLGVLA